MFEHGVGIRNPLFFIGVVEDRTDGRLEGRVRVRAFGIHGTVSQVPTEDLPWAKCVAGNYDANHPLPAVNDWVFGLFLDGREAQQPLVLGLIPTQFTEEIAPEITGWGRITGNVRLDSQSTKSENYGQPQNSRLARCEDLDKTYLAQMEMGRIENIEIAAGLDGVRSTWGEPPTAYNAVYPYNRVIETPGGHCIELDDSSGSERIMIWHTSGSYEQTDTNGTKTDKAVSDKYEIDARNRHLYIGGQNIVTVMGDSRVLINGNKYEEITGNLIQTVHGNHILSVAGQSTINASEEVQVRGAQLRLESNVTGINLKAAKGLFAESGESMHLKSGIAIFQEATNSFNIKAGDNIFIQCDSKLNIKAQNAAIESADTTDVKGNDVRVGGGALVNIDATAVNIDDLIFLADGRAESAQGASGSTGSDPSKAVEAPEPPAKSTSTSDHRSNPSVYTSGVMSVDDTDDTGDERTAGPDDGLRGDGSPEFTTGTPSPGLTPEKAESIKKLAEKYNINPNALAGILSIESKFDPTIQGGASNNFYGIFQLQNTQIAGLTRQVFGRSLSIDEYRNLSFDGQLKVYEKYITNAGASRNFFTGNAKQDASRLWALQLAPSNARSIDYSNPNAVISRTNQANAIEASQGLVTVGSVQNYTVSRGNLL